MKLIISNNYFTIAETEGHNRSFIYEFLKKYTQWVFSRPGIKPTRRNWYYEQGREFRLPISVLEEFEFSAKDRYIPYKVEHTTLHEPTKIEVNLKEGWSARDYQVPMIEYFKDTDYHNKLLPLATGGGKTFSALAAICDIKERTLVVLKSTFIEKWISDIQNTTDTTTDQIYLIQGAPSLVKLFKKLDKGELDDLKFIVMSNRTYISYIHTHLSGKVKYAVHPDDFYQKLGIGVKLIDEVHLDFYATYFSELFTNCKKTIALSATLVDRDPFIKRMYTTIYPPETRYKAPVMDKFITAVAVDYKINPRVHYNTTEYNSTLYSHHAFEKSIIRNKQLMNDYFKMIYDILQSGYLSDYVKGEKAVIFVISIDMANKLTEYLTSMLENHVVSRYIAVDDYDTMLASDVIVTTPQNLGTGVDLPDLKTNILTVNVDSSKTNLQVMGRLRNRNGKPTRFFYTYCVDIDKHRLYHRNRKELIKHSVKSLDQREYRKVLCGYS